ncbi:MAG: ubiquitin-like domain-containing protein, partial [Nocardioidaceae bacterium]
MRSSIALLSKSRLALAVLVAAVAMALVATTVGYAAMSKTVTLSVDGEADQVSTLGGTVSDVLEAEGIEVGERDVVAPGLDTKVNEGTRIAVRYARELQVSVDGRERSYWVTATDVTSALEQLGLRYAGAELSVSRGAEISREGLDLEVVTPKTVTLKQGAQKARKVSVPALTVSEALKDLGIGLRKHDEVKPGLRAELADGDRLTVTRVRLVTKRLTEDIDFTTVERSDSSMLEGETEVVRAGKDGSRSVLYRMRFENGELVVRKALESKVLSEPRQEILRVGTQAPVANFASGDTVWDQLAECESG